MSKIYDELIEGFIGETLKVLTIDLEETVTNHS